MKDLIRLLKKRIKSDDITVTGLCREAGCSRQTFYNIINGDKVPTLPLAERLAKAAGCKITIASVA